MLTQELLQLLNLNVTSIEPVTGGSINTCYKLIAGKTRFFLKLNSAAKFPEMFALEAEGLRVLKNETVFDVPEIISTGIKNGQQFLVLSWKDGGGNTNWEQAGRALALQHNRQNEFFGFSHANYIGSLSQLNTQHSNWTDFYRECRLEPLLNRLHSFLTEDDRRNAATLFYKLKNFFPEEKACLLHGDLWSGNFMFSEKGPCVFDPAIYYGHREMDLAMTRLFGGFHQSFYDAYNETYPLERNWLDRIDLAQLYPMLVHAVLFGGGYLHSVKTTLKKFS